MSISTPARILHVHSGNLYGGIEKVLSALVASETESSLRSEFAICFPGRLGRELASLGKQVEYLDPVRISRPWSILRSRQRLQRLLEKSRFDFACFHSPWSLAIFGPVAKQFGVCSLYWVHGALRSWHWLDRSVKLVRPDFAICNSNFIRNTFKKFLPDVPHEVVYNPVLAPVSNIDRTRRREIRESLGTATDDVVLIQVSRMDEFKGHRLLLTALATMRNTPNWTCWIVGGTQRKHEREYEDELKARTRSLGLSDRVRFLGERHDVPELLQSADVFCQPNTAPEPFGIVFIEAMYAGIPVVTTAIGAGPEVVNNQCGRVVPPENHQALANCLAELSRDPGLRSRLGKNGPARANELCNPLEQLKKLGTLLHRIGKSRQMLGRSMPGDWSNHEGLPSRKSE